MNFHWFKRKGTLILHQGCVSYNRFNCSAGSFAQKAYKWFYLLPSQTNWTRKAFLLHKAVILHITTDGATRTRSVISQVTSAFPKWIISDKRPLASPQKESSQISDCQQPLGHASAAPVCSSCLKVKLQPGKHKATFRSLSSSHKIGEHSSLQCKSEQISSYTWEKLQKH